MQQIFLFCRAGFEKECAAEITDRAADVGCYGYCKAKDNDGFVIFVANEPKKIRELITQLQFSEFIFVRQWFVTAGLIDDLPVDDRVSSLLAAAEQLPPCRELWVEAIDTNEGKSLGVLGRKIKVPFEKALHKGGRLEKTSCYRLHLVFLSGTQAYLGVSRVDNSSQWAAGIPRLKVPKEAPSRATLKLEEAWLHFLPEDIRHERLAGGQKAVDLGAAPGGWTWQLVRQGMYVDAIDNGPMDEALMASGQVNHIRSDGYLYEPKRGVQWLVCDIADKPARTAALMAKWVAKRWCREAVFNLKLPMRQRYVAVQQCTQQIEEQLQAAGIDFKLRFKQLYHDREEVTGHLERLS